MRGRATIACGALLAGGCGVPAPRSIAVDPTLVTQPESSRAEGPLTAVPFHRVAIDDAFWWPWLETHRQASLPACLDRCDETGRIANFARAAGLEEGAHEGLLFNDSDVYKVIEGAAYTLHVRPDPVLEARVDAIIEKIAAAQEEDGYLNTYVQLVDPALRWKNIRHGHELYCAGHLIEAGIAYWQATGKRGLLEVSIRFADLIDADFGPAARRDPPGHEELELALLKLAKVVDPEDGERYTSLARFFIGQRGSTAGRESFGEYAQDHLPVRAQREAVGHAVRAMYLYCGMADLATATGDDSLLDALEDLWEDVVQRKMYVTGGIGSSAGNEGFTQPFDLPNDAAYAETCAAIGMVLWNHRMYLATSEPRYAEIMERALYNGALAGLSMSGDRFFYDNPLGSRGDHLRVPWFDCSCCPSNLVRFLPALGERIYATRGDDELWIALYVGSQTTVEMGGVAVRVRMETDHPWSGDVALRIDPARSTRFELHLRIPAWMEQRDGADGESDIGMDVAVNGEQVLIGTGEVYMLIRSWNPGDVVHVRMPMQPQRGHADERVEANQGRVSVMRGPLVYAAEQADNPAGVRNQALDPFAELTAEMDAELLGGVVKVRGTGSRVTGRAGRARLTDPAAAVTLIPYAFWANREPGEMVVWLPESAELAEVPGEGDVLEQGGVQVSGSHCWQSDTLLALNDGKLPSSSGDQGIPRTTFWDHRGTLEWLQYRFEEPRQLSRSRVYWFDDTGAGNCRVPQDWHLEVEGADGWKPVTLLEAQAYGMGIDSLQEVRFVPVESAAVRLVLALQPQFSAGVLEWEVGP